MNRPYLDSDFKQQMMKKKKECHLCDNWQFEHWVAIGQYIKRCVNIFICDNVLWWFY